MDRRPILELLNDRDLSDVHPNRRPRKAASLIVWHGSLSDPFILMGKRADSLKFMPGKYVFPGGALERADSFLQPAKPLPDKEQRILGPSGQGLAMAAIRECFEETGLRLAGAPHTQSTSPHWQAYTSHGSRPDLSKLNLLARAITPPRRIRRFDTYFFTTQADKIAAETDLNAHENSEILSLQWVKLCEAHTLDVAPMTRAILMEAQNHLISPSKHPPLFQVVRGKFICREAW